MVQGGHNKVINNILKDMIAVPEIGRIEPFIVRVTDGAWPDP